MITQQDRDKYRYALEDAGVPEVIAFMAAENMNAIGSEMLSERFILSCAFPWVESRQGFDFWHSVEDNLLSLHK